MTKTYILKTQTVPADRSAVETYLAPPPPSKGKIIGLDCHPDTFTAAFFVGQTPHDARKIGSRENLSLDALLKWAAAELTPQDIILMEAGSNSFELCKRLGNLGLKACVLESCHVGKHAKTYADNDKMAAPPASRWSIWQAMPPASGCPTSKAANAASCSTPTARPLTSTPPPPTRSNPTSTVVASACGKRVSVHFLSYLQ